jgi:hypothetical protein
MERSGFQAIHSWISLPATAGALAPRDISQTQVAFASESQDVMRQPTSQRSTCAYAVADDFRVLPSASVRPPTSLSQEYQ